MADPRGFKPINQLWQSATVSTDQDSECLYEEIPGRSQDTDRPAGAAVGQQGEEEEEQLEEENVGGSRRSLDFGVQVGDSSDFWGESRREEIVARGGTIPRSRTDGGARSRSGSVDRRLSDRARQRDIRDVRVEEERYAARRSYVESGTGAVLPPPAATGHKLTRGRASANTVARYLHSASTNVSAAHYHHHHHGLHGQYPPGGRTTGRQHRHHHPSRGSYSNETQEEVQEDDEATLRELLVRYVLRTRTPLPPTRGRRPVSSPFLGSSIPQLSVYTTLNHRLSRYRYNSRTTLRQEEEESLFEVLLISSIRYEPLDGTIITATFSSLVLKNERINNAQSSYVITLLSCDCKKKDLRFYVTLKDNYP